MEGQPRSSIQLLELELTKHASGRGGSALGREEKERGFGVVVPAALLAEALLDAGDDDERRLGVHGADLVAAVVCLGVAQIHAAPFHLAPRLLLLRAGGTASPGRGRSSSGRAGARGGALSLPATTAGGGPAPAGHVLLEVDLLAELEPVRVVAGPSSPASAAARLHCRRRRPLAPRSQLL